MKPQDDVLPTWIDDIIENCNTSWKCPIYRHLTDAQLKLLGKPLCFMEREYGRDWKCDAECKLKEQCKRRSSEHTPVAEAVRKERERILTKITDWVVEHPPIDNGREYMNMLGDMIDSLRGSE